MRRPLIAGNWKMNLGRSEAIELASSIARGIDRADVDVALFPPALWVADAADHVVGSGVAVGAQNCSHLGRGAVTGEVAADQVADIATHVLIGHSERRQLAGEDDELIREKLDAALLAGLTPVVCVGESANVRAHTGEYIPFVLAQVRAALRGRSAGELARIVVAYEPIWAIGTGMAATPGDAQEMAEAIRRSISELASGAGESTRILYGGSVNAGNASELLAQPDVDGALVGGASLIAKDFLTIVKAAPTRD